MKTQGCLTAYLLFHMKFIGVLTWSFMLISSSALAQRGTIPGFPLEPCDIALSRLAQPATYFDKVGRKFAILGYESGTFEAWAYPLKLVRNFEFSFLIGSSTVPIQGHDIVRWIDVTPEATTLTYTSQSFTIRAIYVTPISQPGAIILLDVNSTEPLTIVCSFLPVLQPMWPAGIGGQYAAWDNETSAYLISEPRRLNHGYVGSPAASGISYTPAHMLSDVPNQFKIDIAHPDSLRGRYIPVILAGGKGKRDDIKAVYQRLAANPEQYYRENVRHYRELQANTLHATTPNRELNLAFAWGKVAYDNLVVDNPDLGVGMVAGLGPSGTGGRPGFGWFFGGDAYMNSLSLDSYGAHNTVRDALAFTRKWQRDDGKMAHELSQAAGYINWFKDYPYGYIHGDTSPFYIVASYDYFAMTADSAFIRESWPSLQKAYAWSASTDENGDGLMDNKKAGLGASEYGSLTEVQSDIYTAAVWVRATRVMSTLARVAGSDSMARAAERDYVKSEKTFTEKFWDEKNEQYSYAFDAQGRQVPLTSPWSAVGFIWNLGDPRRTARSIEKLNSADLSTDWGTRGVSIKAPLFEPLNYNYGAVWPFITGWVATAQYKHHFLMQGYGQLMANVRHTFDNGLGYVTELYSGYQDIWPGEAVAHQGFSTGGVILPFVRGMLGLEGDAPNRKITFEPHFPANWDTVTITNYRVGRDTFAFAYMRTDSLLRMTIRRTGKGGDPYTVRVAPAFGAGTRLHNVFANGQVITYGTSIWGPTVQPVAEVGLSDSLTLEIEFTPTIELLPPPVDTRTGDMNHGLKIVATSWMNNRLEVTVEGIAGETYQLPVLHPRRAGKVTGAVLQGNALVITLPEGKGGEFVRGSFDVETR